MNNDDLPPISPERWESKFTSDPEIIPAPPEVPEILEQLRAGKISASEAEGQLVQLGFSVRSAQLTIQEYLKDQSGPHNSV